MGFFDFLKRGLSSNKCSNCKQEFDSLPHSKKLDGSVERFCSKKCSQEFRKKRKKLAKKPPSTGSSLPW